MGPKTVQSKLLVELTGQPARAPLSRPMQLHRVEPHLHTVRLRVFGKRPIGRKQKELRVVASVFIKGFDLPTPSFMLAIVDLRPPVEKVRLGRLEFRLKRPCYRRKIETSRRDAVLRLRELRSPGIADWRIGARSRRFRRD